MWYSHAVSFKVFAPTPSSVAWQGRFFEIPSFEENNPPPVEPFPQPKGYTKNTGHKTLTGEISKSNKGTAIYNINAEPNTIRWHLAEPMAGT